MNHLILVSISFMIKNLLKLFLKGILGYSEHFTLHRINTLPIFSSSADHWT